MIQWYIPPLAHQPEAQHLSSVQEMEYNTNPCQTTIGGRKKMAKGWAIYNDAKMESTQNRSCIKKVKITCQPLQNSEKKSGFLVEHGKCSVRWKSPKPLTPPSPNWPEIIQWRWKHLGSILFVHAFVNCKNILQYQRDVEVLMGGQ